MLYHGASDEQVVQHRHPSIVTSAVHHGNSGRFVVTAAWSLVLVLVLALALVLVPFVVVFSTGH